MIVPLVHMIRLRIAHRERNCQIRSTPSLIALLFAFPALAPAQIGGSPFESGFNALQTCLPELSPRSPASSPSRLAVTCSPTENRAPRNTLARW